MANQERPHLRQVHPSSPSFESEGPNPVLKSGGGSGTFDSMEIVDAKIAAAEARTDTKFERVLSRLDGIEHSTRGTKATIILTAIAAVGTAIAVMAFGATQFGNGIMVTTAAVEDSAEAKRISQESANEVRALRTEIMGLIQAIERPSSP